MRDLTGKQQKALGALCWGLRHFDGLYTNSQVSRRTVLQLVKRGEAESIGFHEALDEDTDTCRVRETFRPTKTGVLVALGHALIEPEVGSELLRKLDDCPIAEVGGVRIPPPV